jgi:glycine/D-amino acid oxidase-like deaminating enzyme
MRGDAAVVVAGGGIVGCSIAYHLAVAGCRDVVLVEKGGLTSGTTFHSVGLVSQFRTSPADTHTMGRNIGLAYLPLALARPGTAVAVESFGQLVPAEVGAAPLWDPRGERVRV